MFSTASDADGSGRQSRRVAIAIQAQQAVVGQAQPESSGTIRDDRAHAGRFFVVGLPQRRYRPGRAIHALQAMLVAQQQAPLGVAVQRIDGQGAVCEDVSRVAVLVDREYVAGNHCVDAAIGTARE